LWDRRCHQCQRSLRMCGRKLLPRAELVKRDVKRCCGWPLRKAPLSSRRSPRAALNCLAPGRGLAFGAESCTRSGGARPCPREGAREGRPYRRPCQAKAWPSELGVREGLKTPAYSPPKAGLQAGSPQGRSSGRPGSPARRQAGSWPSVVGDVPSPTARRCRPDPPASAPPPRPGGSRHRWAGRRHRAGLATGQASGHSEAPPGPPPR